MKARIKFRKKGVMKFIGHLDVMRYFQKAMRRAEIPIAFTGGYSPHMIMSFANPLGVGLTSDGEYFDIELTEPVSSLEAVKRLNETMVEGMEVVNFVEIPDTKKETGMAIVAAADYLVSVSGCMELFSEDALDTFLAQEEILIEKETKKSRKVMNIRPLIYQMEKREEGFYLLVAAGSKENLKPSLVMEAYLAFLGKRPEDVYVSCHRLEMYAVTVDEEEERSLIPLIALGTTIE